MKIENIREIGELTSEYYRYKSKSERLEYILDRAELLSKIMGEDCNNSTSLIYEAVSMLLRQTNNNLSEIKKRIEQM